MKKGVGAGLLWLGLLLTEEAHAQITPPPSGGGGGTPGGANTQVQFNKAGAFGGITGATSDGTSLSVTTQSASDVSTKAASDAFVATAIANAIAGINPAVAVQAATTAAADTSGFTYNNGAAGIGATFTGSVNTAVTIDGFTFTALGQRLLVKNDTQSPSGAFNGIYYVTQVQTSLLPPILTRALDYDQPSDINNTGAIPVVNGTANALTSWLLTSSVTTVGTDSLTYAQFSVSPSAPITLTTTGTSGAATLSGATPPVLNIPQYTGGIGAYVGTPSCSNCSSSTGVIILTGNSPSVGWSSIPGTYNNLRLNFCCRTDRAANSDDVIAALNSDTGDNYNVEIQSFSGNSTAAPSLTNGTTGFLASVAAASATANRPGCIETVIQNYTSTTFQKIMRTDSGYDQGTSGISMMKTATIWIPATPAAITSITLTPSHGTNFVAGSCFYLTAW